MINRCHCIQQPCNHCKRQKISFNFETTDGHCIRSDKEGDVKIKLKSNDGTWIDFDAKYSWKYSETIIPLHLAQNQLNLLKTSASLLKSTKSKCGGRISYEKRILMKFDDDDSPLLPTEFHIVADSNEKMVKLGPSIINNLTTVVVDKKSICLIPQSVYRRENNKRVNIRHKIVSPINAVIESSISFQVGNYFAKDISKDGIGIITNSDWIKLIDDHNNLTVKICANNNTFKIQGKIVYVGKILNGNGDFYRISIVFNDISSKLYQYHRWFDEYYSHETKI